MGKLERIFRCGCIVEEVSAEGAKRSGLALIESLLRCNDGVRVLLGNTEHSGDLTALERVTINGEGDLRCPDEPSDYHLDRGEIPTVWLGLEGIDDRLDSYLLAESVASQHD